MGSNPPTPEQRHGAVPGSAGCDEEGGPVSCTPDRAPVLGTALAALPASTGSPSFVFLLLVPSGGASQGRV